MKYTQGNEPRFQPQPATDGRPPCPMYRIQENAAWGQPYMVRLAPGGILTRFLVALVFHRVAEQIEGFLGSGFLELFALLF